MTKKMTPQQINELIEQTREAFADEDAAAAVREAQIKAGRQALGERKGQSPQITFRVTQPMKKAAAVRAAAEGKTVSELAREAFERYLTAA